MTVAAVQFRGTADDVAGNLLRLASLAEAASAEADIVVMPELAATHYVMADREGAAQFAEEPEGPTFAALSPLAKATQSWLVCGFVERAGDDLFNSALVIDPAGSLAFVYRKTCLFDADFSWATPGDSGYRVFDTGRGKFTVGICMDLNDDAFIDWVAASDADLVCAPCCWLDQGHSVHGYWAARMAPAGRYLAVANTWGVEGSRSQRTRFRGESAIIDVRQRRLLAAAPLRGDLVITGTLNGD